tara:strand:+ start:2186 stop:2380 length:195 start_codon:yes stop_codon:yes gene_type:complete
LEEGLAMKKQVTLTVVQQGPKNHCRYRVKKIVNSVAWSIGSYLSKEQMEQIVADKFDPVTIVVQ